MKHTVEVKFPKIFGRKKKDSDDVIKEEGSHITTEITIDVDRLKKTAKKLAVPATIGVTGLSIGYLVGFKSGVVKVLDTEVIVVEK